MIRLPRGGDEFCVLSGGSAPGTYIVAGEASARGRTYKGNRASKEAIRMSTSGDHGWAIYWYVFEFRRMATPNELQTRNFDSLLVIPSAARNNMFSLEERFEILKTYFQSQCCVAETVRILKRNMGRDRAPTEGVIRKLVRKVREKGINERKFSLQTNSIRLLDTPETFLNATETNGNTRFAAILSKFAVDVREQAPKKADRGWKN
ncbi:hypothetical protein G5I_12672 [Acromyrmex echinatior]|uniref:DUF4817 domain-containing protein n=1 Tax=Acromyrmex echinatior TaxID=103372 RepID=F4X2Y7_ACREC|nr:hypothetical protein G5I_12672 [Acromyrmex echinatior]